LNLNSEYTGKPYTANKGKFSDGWVEEVKFSPDGQYIAYGTHGQSMVMEFLQMNGKKLSLLKEAKAGTSAVLHIDWSRDSSMISLNTQAAELIFLGTTGSNQSASSVCN
jgi:WD40 repeat protein